MPPAPPPALAARFARLIAALCEAVAARGGGPGGRGLAGPLVIAIWTRLRRMEFRITRLAARVAAGPLPPPRSRPAAARATVSRPPELRLPRGFAWLVRLVPAAASGAGQLETLLADPAMKALIEAAPQIGRTLRPLCHLLGVRPPPILQKPARVPPRQAEAGRPPPGEPPGAAPRRPHRPRPAPEVAGLLSGLPVPA